MTPTAPLCRRAVRPLLSPSLLTLVTAALCWAGGLFPALAAPPAAADLPAAAAIKPGAQPIGPVRIDPQPSATGGLTLFPNDLVIYDYGFTGSSAVSNSGGAILNASVRNNGSGTETILASTSVGSGVTFGQSLEGNSVAVSPTGLIYYFYNGKDLVQLNPSTLVRTVVSDHNNTALGTAPVSVSDLTWDFATGTILYFDFATANLGFWRVDPATGVRTAVSLNSNNPGGGIAIHSPIYMVTDPYGNLFYIELDTVNQNLPIIVAELPVTAAGATTYGARRVVSSNSVGSQAGGAFIGLQGLWVDNSQTVTLSNGLPVAESLIVSDEGNDQTSSALFRVPTDSGNHAKLITYNGTNANTGNASFDLPVSAVTDTTGRIYYDELHNGINGILTAIAPGTHAANSTTDTNLSIEVPSFVPVPPPTPTVATPTTSNVAGTTATLNGNVTADGGVQNAGVLARGFVYAQTSTNSAPKIGGTGVTQVVNFQATSAPAAQGSNLGTFTSNVTGLTQGISYTFAAYARDQAGITYSTPVTFATASAPSVTTNAASSIAGTAATLNGNVTSNGGATLSARGFVYSSTNTTPTIGGTGVTNLVDGGTATGTYADTAAGLSTGTLYYFRAYATNAVNTTYGSVLSFTTVAPPTANSQTVNVGFNTATPVTLTGSDPNTPAQTLTYAVTSQPGHGTLSGTAPNLTYTPTANYHGADTFQFTTTNTTGLTSSAATVTLNVATGTPTANSQSVSVGFNTATSVTLTGSDPDSPALTLTYTVVTTPIHGTLSGTAPNLTYTPTANYQGADSFTFRISNGTNNSNTATVTLNVAAGTPTANSQSTTTAFNTARAITLSGTDPDSPALTLTYTVVTAPMHGTLSGTAPNLTYTPAANYQGSDSFTFTVSNGQKTSSAATVSITVSPGTPTASTQSVSTTFNTAVAVTLSATDPDSPALALTYTVVTTPTHGTLSGTAPNLTYTPAANYQGSDSFTFRASNGTNTSNTATVAITVAAGTPTANSQSVSVGFNTATAITLNGTDPDSPALALTYTVAAAPTHGTLSGTAPNLTYTPTANYQGADAFTFTVSNGQKTSSAATVSLTVAAGTPTANSQSVNVNLNLPRTLTLSGTDPDSPALALTYTVATAPTHGTLTGTAPNLTYTPTAGYAGADSFTFTVSNGQKTSAPATVSLSVIGQPTISSFTPASGPAGTLVTVTGTNLQNATGVNFFRNVAGTNFTVVSSTQVTVRVPAGATTGTLTVFSGSGSNSSSTKFQVTPTP